MAMVCIQEVHTTELPMFVMYVRLQASGFQASGFRLQASGFRLQASGFRLQASGFSFLYIRVNVRALVTGSSDKH